MSNTPTTPEEYAEQEEAKRQDLIEQDKALHAETDEPAPFPGERVETGDKPKKSKK